jgi:hypothetical protein
VGRWARKLAWLVIPLAVVGEAGHQLLERLGQVLAHHFFHILFGLGAVAVFTIYAIVDIRRHGWPAFSWRLNPHEGARPEPRSS